MARAMVTRTDVVDWGPQTEGIDTDVMDRCINAASEMIEQATGVRFLQAAYTAQHSGSRATGAMCERILLADPNGGLATPNVTAIGSLKENAITLSTTLIPTGSALTAMDGAIIDTETGEAIRCDVASGNAVIKAWAPGVVNISIVYTAGWSLTSMPEDIKHAAIELTKLIYREGFRVGVSGYSAGGASSNFRGQLSGVANAAIDAWTRFQPRTVGP